MGCGEQIVCIGVVAEFWDIAKGLLISPRESDVLKIITP